MKPSLLKSATALALCAGLGGCFNGDDDEPMMNSAPVTMDSALITQTDTPLTGTLSATDADNDNLSFTLVSDVAMGSLTIMANGQFTYTPNYTYTGADSFTYQVSDNIGGSATATVSITVESLQLSFADYSRQAFMQSASDTPLPINGRVFTQDVAGTDTYADLFLNN
jgi:VCBS repeat-containing protein